MYFYFKLSILHKAMVANKNNEKAHQTAQRFLSIMIKSVAKAY